MNLPKLTQIRFSDRLAVASLEVAMVSHVVAFLFKQIKIFKAIVVSFFINMVDFFFAKKTVKSFFYNKYMFKNVPISISFWVMRLKKFNIAISVRGFSAFPVIGVFTSFVKVLARLATDYTSTLFKTRWVNFEFFTTLFANTINHAKLVSNNWLDYNRNNLPKQYATT
jgi:hypothetical protein